MRVLVTGGTGFVGRSLVVAFRDRGDDAVVVSRRPGPREVGWEVIDSEVARADAVVHLAGEPIANARWTKRRLQRIRESRVQPTRAIASAIERSARKPRVFVSASAVGIYGMREDDEELDESAPSADDVLASTAVAWEGAADLPEGAGVRVVHPRIGIVLGRDGGALPRMAAPYRWFAGGPLGTGRQWIGWIHLLDAVRALVFAVDCDSLAGPVNVVAPEPVTMHALSQSIARALHRPAALRVPPFVLKLVLGRGLAQALLTGQRAVPRRLIEAGFVFRFPRIREACADLL